MGKMAEKGEIVLYQPEGEVKLEVRVENETNSVVAKFATTTEDDKTYQVEHYDPDLTLSIGYRVKSSNGIKFRRWANQILKDHLLKGYSISPRMMTVGMQVESRFRKQEKIIEAHSAQLDSQNARIKAVEDHIGFFETIRHFFRPVCYRRGAEICRHASKGSYRRYLLRPYYP